jgi:hypothetical protein
VTKGIVFHCADNTASPVVVNSCGSDCTGAVTLGANSSALAATGLIGGGFHPSGQNTAGPGIVGVPQIIHFGFGPQNPQLTIQIRFKLNSFSSDLNNPSSTADIALVSTTYFGEHGYFLGIDHATHQLYFEGSYVGGIRITSPTVLQVGVWYGATAIYDRPNGELYLGQDYGLQSLEATGALVEPYDTPLLATVAAYYPNAGYLDGIIDEIRVHLGVIAPQVIPPIPPPPPDCPLPDGCVVSLPLGTGSSSAGCVPSFPSTVC